jgi:ABC-type nickel/cobalt efflux system permease component RcnA
MFVASLALVSSFSCWTLAAGMKIQRAARAVRTAQNVAKGKQHAHRQQKTRHKHIRRNYAFCRRVHRCLIAAHERSARAQRHRDEQCG